MALPVALSVAAGALIAPSADTKLLVVGASGGTGTRALRGLLDIGYAGPQLRVLTRNPSRLSLAPLRALGVEICGADLDEPDSLVGVGASCTGCYVHSTAGDTKQLDTGEVLRAQNLASALKAGGDVEQVVYNSAAAEPTHAVERISQKHAVEVVFSAEFGLPATHLRANLFMEVGCCARTAALGPLR